MKHIKGFIKKKTGGKQAGFLAFNPRLQIAELRNRQRSKIKKISDFH